MPVLSINNKKRSHLNTLCRIFYPLFKKVGVLAIKSGAFRWNRKKMTFNNCPRLLKFLIEVEITSYTSLKTLFIDNLTDTDFKARTNKKQ